MSRAPDPGPDAPPAGASRLSPRVRSLLRFATTITLLGVALQLAVPDDGSPLLPSLVAAWVVPPLEALGWFALGSSAYLVATGFAALRFVVLLRGANLEARFASTFRAYLFANFLGMAMPSPVVGDAYRFADARRESGRGAEVLGSLVLERLLGLAALCAVGLMAAPFIPGSAAAGALAWTLVAVSGAVFVGTGVALHPLGQRLAKAAVDLLGRLWPRAADAAGRSLDAVASMSRRPRLVAGAAFLSLLCQSIPVAGVYSLSLALDSQVAPYWFPVIVPFVMAVALLPVSIGGAGVRESLYVSLFGAAGMRPEVALSLSLSIVAANLVWGVFGLLFFAIGRSNAPDSAAAAAE